MLGGVWRLPLVASVMTLECLDSASITVFATLPVPAGRMVCAYSPPSVTPRLHLAVNDGWVLSRPRQKTGMVLIVADPPRLGFIKPSDVYHLGYQDYLQGRYQLAIEQFEKFVDDFPTNSLAPQAHYYLGECYQNIGNLTLAAKNFSLIITRHKERLPNYQNSRQVPPALFRLGSVYEETGKRDKAKAFWGILLTDYPSTSEAHLAKKRLKQLP